jgi:hypothetical protein
VLYLWLNFYNKGFTLAEVWKEGTSMWSWTRKCHRALVSDFLLGLHYVGTIDVSLDGVNQCRVTELISSSSPSTVSSQSTLETLTQSANPLLTWIHMVGLSGHPYRSSHYQGSPWITS